MYFNVKEIESESESETETESLPNFFCLDI